MKKIGIPLLLLAGIAAIGLAILHHFHRWPFSTSAPQVAQATAPAAEEAPPAAGHVKLTAEQVKNAQIQADPLAPGTFRPQIALLGTLQEDPDSTLILRAPAAGTLKRSDQPWPQLGQSLKGPVTIGAIEPRLAPSDQIAQASQRASLQTQVAAAQSDLAGATASAESSRASYERLKALNAQDKYVSDRAVEEALARLRADEARLNGARQAALLATNALQAMDVQLASLPITINGQGQVAEVTAHPGENVEAGQQLLRLVAPEKLLAALNVPLGEHIAPDITDARILLPGRNDSLPAALLRTLPAPVDPRTRESVLLARLTLPPSPDALAAPGTPITATLAAPGQPLQGFIVPRTSVVRYQGKAWVYLASKEEGSFNRQEVSLEHPLADGSGWFVNQGFKGDERLVTTGAATLLSGELIALGG